MASSPATGIVTLHPRGILFDMDGVLVSSLGSVERTWEIWAKKRGIDPTTAIQAAQGRRAIETVRLLRPDLNDVEELEWLERMEIEDKAGLEALAGVERILETLPPRYWTVVTSATERLARSRMEHGGIRVPARFVTAEMVKLGKPDPEPYRKGAELLGLSCADCMVIEDSASGVKAGHAAGCMVLATLYSQSAESLREADWIVHSLEEVEIQTAGETLAVRFTPIQRPVTAGARP